MRIRDTASTLAGAVRETAATARSLRRNSVRHRPAPPEHGLVLDVGSGQAAHPRADLIVDKYVADDFERGSPIDLTKPLVVADGHALPFADHSFDYVIASHVLEHATDVSAFAGELQRVGRAGFVQVPSREAELTFGWPFHPWLIDREGDALVFHPRGDKVAPVGQLFHESFARSRLFALWFGAHRDTWHHTLHWSGSFEARATDASAAPATAALDVERTLSVLPEIGATGPTGALRDLLRCPADGGTLADEAGWLRCATCGLAYPRSSTGVPVLLAEAASTG